MPIWKNHFNKEELLIRINKLLELRKNLQQYYLKKAGLADVDHPRQLLPQAGRYVE